MMNKNKLHNHDCVIASLRAYRSQRGIGHVTPIVSCIPSKIQTRQWFVTNYCDISCLGSIVKFLLFLAYRFEFCQVPRYMPSSPLG